MHFTLFATDGKSAVNHSQVRINLYECGYNVFLMSTLCVA